MAVGEEAECGPRLPWRVVLLGQPNGIGSAVVGEQLAEVARSRQRDERAARDFVVAEPGPLAPVIGP
jgi:hypothetical protein